MIEHPQRPGYKLLEPAKATETTANANRFEVKLAASRDAKRSRCARSACTIRHSREAA